MLSSRSCLQKDIDTIFGVIPKKLTIFHKCLAYLEDINIFNGNIVMRVQSGFILLVISMMGGISVRSQSDSIPAKIPNYPASYFTNSIALAKSPARWSRENWFQFGGSVAIVGSLIPMDQVLNIPFENWESTGAIKIGKTGDVIGDLPFQFGLTGAAIGVGYLTGNKQIQHFGFDNLQAQLFTGGITFFMKELFHRARPETGSDNFTWFGPFNGGDNTSFFSGHTSLAFSTATMIFLHSGQKWWVGLLGYGIASGVGISRLQQQKHWSSDIVAGAIVGTAVSGFIYRQQQKRRIQKTANLKPIP